MQLSFTQKKHIRKNFGKLVEGLSIPNLIEVQKNSYSEFLESKSLNEQLNDLSKGLDKVLVTGGGAYNDYLIDIIRSKTDSEIIIPSKNIIEFKEALIFAFLGVLRNLNINNCYSSVTGASKDHCSGKIFLLN